ncbi:16S rRNA (cytosine(967)-C(5))-methyltransferase RsmB [bacterium]|nr:16S rRNA (cytosine(967)-C(5))-methyltransferase RsmB [bacterium]
MKETRRNAPRGPNPRSTPKPPPKPVSSARRGALAMLEQARDPRAPGMDTWLDEARSRGEISPQDAALAREIAYGVCRHRRRLERVVDRYIERPLPKGAWHVYETLLIGAYQVIYLDRVPSHSIVDESVRLVASARTEVVYKGLVNAIMRRVVAEYRETPEPPGEDQVNWLERYSVPDWLASEGGQVYRSGSNEKFFAASNEAAPLQLRITGQSEGLSLAEIEERLRGEIVDISHTVPEIERGRFVEECLTINGRGIAPEFLPCFRRGLVTAEDEGGQIAGWLTGARPGMRILDLCASPGGKSAHMVDLARRDVQLVACDVSEQKLHRLRETLQRVGILNLCELKLAGSVAADGYTESFDLALVDAPCSGLGTLRRHPEIRWRRSTRDLRALSRQQSDLLEQAAALVKVGGTLVYTVCTFTVSETQDVVTRFLDEHREFRLTGAPDDLPFDEKAFRVAEGRWRSAPHLHGCDAFFIARFRKNSPTVTGT